jgi:hypothetical protein
VVDSGANVGSDRVARDAAGNFVQKLDESEFGIEMQSGCRTPARATVVA